MATLITKNSSTASAAPLAADLTQGELAVNVTDKKLYTKNASGTVVQIGGEVTLTGTETLTNKTLTSPTLTAPVLGTPASGTVTNLTGTASININGTVGTTTAAAGAFTTLSATSTLGVTGVSTLTGGAVVQGLTVGRGGGAVVSNTVVGNGAGFSNSTSPSNVYFGYQAGYSNTTNFGSNTFIGSRVGYLTTGYSNTFIGGNASTGLAAGYYATTGNNNVIIGGYTGFAAPISETGSNFVVLSDGEANIVASTKTGQTFALQGGTLSAGTGITFPATQSASSNANTLDDYEEGTWTPVITDGTNNATMATGNGATYTKIGRSVTVNGCCFTSSLGSVTGVVKISGLPFTVASTNNFYGAGAVYVDQLNITAGQSVMVVPSASTTTMSLTINNSAAGATNMTPTQWSSDGFGLFSCTYFV
jgi:hypothetical protein